MDEEHTITVENCARCGGNHEVSYKELERPFVESSGNEWTHWGSCPVNGDPILIKFSAGAIKDRPPIKYGFIWIK